MFLQRSLLALIFASSCAQTARGQNDPAWTTPLPPFKIAGNLYYVGSKDLASYLVVTPQGNILINSSLTTSEPLIRDSIEALGFHFQDVKILLISHAHYDHAGGSAAIVKSTSAKYMVMAEDLPLVQSGGKADSFYDKDPSAHFPPAKVDRVLHDGDTVKLGDAVLVAHLTPGHTPGCTTWTMTVVEDGKSYNVVIVGGTNVNPGFNLVDNPKYPRIAQDYAAAFRALKSLPCDLFLGAHGSYFGMARKMAAQQPGWPSTLIDPTGYQRYVENRQKAFEAELAKQSRPIP